MHPRTHQEGDKYGRLLNIAAYVRCENGRWYHLMKCDCGTEKEVAGGELRKGAVKSCGCLRKEQKFTHGMTKTPEYWVWSAMRQRCENKNDANYKNYGGRGVSVCERWHDFEIFIADMGKRPNKKSTIDRIDNDKGYSPENCVWTGRTNQSRNQRLRKDNTTGHKGVYKISGKEAYFSKITVNRKSHYLGYFKSKEEAIEARQKAEAKYFKRDKL